MKPSRLSRLPLPWLVLLAAAQLSCADFLGTPALAADTPAGWSSLWRTPDQQGQALLDSGQPAQAAARFHDPRWRAYADLEANRYGQAAKLLAPFTDPQSEYNRGNALARSGQLQAALTAYDAALKQDPADGDIRHNRDLVARALQQQHQSQSSGRNGRQGGQAGSSPGQRSGQSGGGQQGSSGSQPSGNGSQQSGAANRSDASGHSQSGQSGNAQGASAPQAANAAGARTSGDAPGQARRDAAQAAALAREQRQQGSTGNTGQAQGSQGMRTTGPGEKSATPAADTGSLLAGGARTPKQKPQSERQLALEQWLRQIPDNAAGLLRRKFLIEHMMRQQDGGDPQGDAQ